MAAKNAVGICMTKGCDKPVRCRGLCVSCYFSARKLIKTKQIPGWCWLVRQGLALAEKRTPLMREVKKKLRAKKAASK